MDGIIYTYTYISLAVHQVHRSANLLVSILRTLPGKLLEEISLNIHKFNIHAMVIIGGFEVWHPGPPRLISRLTCHSHALYTLKVIPPGCLKSCLF